MRAYPVRADLGSSKAKHAGWVDACRDVVSRSGSEAAKVIGSMSI